MINQKNNLGLAVIAILFRKILLLYIFFFFWNSFGKQCTELGHAIAFEHACSNTKMCL